MTDLRRTVVDNRSLLKNIELCIPGFRGYRLKEDIRTADNILRSYIADQNELKVQVKLKRVRDVLSQSLELDILNDVGGLINTNKGLIAKIRHAEHGYSGISPQYIIEENGLNQIYDYDRKLIDSNDILALKIDLLADNLRKNDLSEIKKSLSEIRTDIEMFNELFDKRRSLLIVMTNEKDGW